VDAEIIAIGSELLTPFRQDTNSLFLTDRLNQLGIEVRFKDVVGDSHEDLVAAARIALFRCDVVIFMGGLGPTEDDLTREAVAQALGLQLKRDPELLASLYKRFAERKLKMPENNAKQADVIAGASILPNPNGSAVGLWVPAVFEGKSKIVILLPGPPHELKPMWDDHCQGRLRDAAPPLAIATRMLRMAIIGESACDAIAAPVYKKYKDVQTTILAGAGECQLHLRARADKKDKAQARVDKLADELEDALGEYVFSTAGESLEQIVGYWLQMRGATLAVAESCTGGLIAQRITSVAGSSRYFLGGAVVYADDLKSGFADVPRQLLKEKGAVSKEVAAALADGIRKRCKATIGVGVTGIAGPAGGSDEKPVGLVFHAIADGNKTDVVERKWMGDRERVRLWASQQALDMIRRRLI
jgi:competence/damage-inducible protein CinA-like protein